MTTDRDITHLLAQVNAGRTGAEEEVLLLLYDELRGLAHHLMGRERSGHTLQTTALVHEAFLRLGGEKRIRFEDRGHYMRLSARAMRRVLIDHARLKKGLKRGGGGEREALELVEPTGLDPGFDLVDLDDALTELAEADPQLAQLVELRYFGGFTIEDTAEALGVSPGTVKNHWKVARMWLKSRMGAEEE